VECVSDPAVLPAVVSPRDRDHVKPALRTCGFAVMRHEVACGCNQSVPFRGVNAVGAATEAVVAAKANLDKNTSRAVAHDQVDLAATRAVVAADQA
jgi:hypothetical protein